MKIIKTDIEEVLIFEPNIFQDHRGWFSETYSKKKLAEHGINIEFVQDNHSMSTKKGTLRGLHFQHQPKAQSKLVRCTKGKILDVAVDLRKGSSTYCKWVSIELSEDNMRQLLIPKGFAHGFVTLTDDAEVQYKVDEYYDPSCDRSIRYDDPNIGVNWNFTHPILSDKDLNAPYLNESDMNFSLKFMITGKSGQLGHDVYEKFTSMKYNIISPNRYELDLSNKQQVEEYIIFHKPDIIIHCAAYTAVDKAEIERELCYAVNVEGTEAIVSAAQKINAKLVYISSDYVFDGLEQLPHKENDVTSSINYYGLTKKISEDIIKGSNLKYFIVRTSWLYGINGGNFVKTMLNLAKGKDEISVVNDQIGSPTYTKDLADFIHDLIQTESYGIYHGVNEGFCSWYEFAKAIFDKSHCKTKVIPITSEEYKTLAVRPLNSRLSTENSVKAKVTRLPHWENALERFLSVLGKKD